MRTISEMEIQFMTVLKSIIASASTFFSTGFGKLVTLMGFFSAIGLGAIAPLIHIILGFVAIDLFLGICVTIKNKGWGHILSSRLRNSLFKAFFYVIIVVGLFLIESRLIEGYAITSKLAFALISGTELWSILANMMILLPSVTVFSMIKSLLAMEIAKKLDKDEREINDLLNQGENDS